MPELGYPYTIRPLEPDEGGGYLIAFPDLPGCISDGETVAEAVANGADALRCWLAAMAEAGRPVPACPDNAEEVHYDGAKARKVGAS